MKAGSGAMMIREGKWKLIDQLGSGGFSSPKRVRPEKGGPKGQLYDLSSDPSEKTNLWSEYPGLVQRLSKRLEQIAGELIGTREQVLACLRLQDEYRAHRRRCALERCSAASEGGNG